MILDDKRDPDVSWKNHLARNSDGGVDLAYPYGTKVVAPAAGRLVADNTTSGSGGRMAILHIDHPQIERIEFLHLEKAIDGNVSIGDEIGLSGASGFGKDRGYEPHLHVHAYDKSGERVNLWHYFTPISSSPASTTTKSASQIGSVIRSGRDWAYRRPQGDLAKRVVNALIKKNRLSKSYKNDGDPREVFDRAVQRTLNFSNVFRGLEDGKIERGGSYGIQDYATLFGDYKKRGGKRDGRPEELSWECFALGLERP